MIYAYGMKNAPLVPPVSRSRSGIITGFPVVGKGLGGLPVRAPLTIPHASGIYTVSGELVVPAGVVSLTVGGKGEDGYYNAGYWYWEYRYNTYVEGGNYATGTGGPTWDPNNQPFAMAMKGDPTSTGDLCYVASGWYIDSTSTGFEHWIAHADVYGGAYSPDDYYYAQGVTTINANGTIYTCPSGGYSSASHQDFPVTLRGGGARISYTVGSGCNFTFSY